MDIIDSPSAMQAWSLEQHRGGRVVALVPTMGALHAGHVSLIDEAARHADVVVVSIFVNPLQFNRRDDFDRYPRNIEDDLEQCRQRGVAAVYAPTQQTMYPSGFQTHVEPGQLAEPLEGAGRPGHFRGVTTVVNKLFGAVRPDVAVFGQKDYQQLAIVTRMVTDLDMGIQIVGLPTVRETDGLAMSSRNARLDTASRQAAVVVPAALEAVSAAVLTGELDRAKLRAVAADVVADQPLARLEYVDVVDPATLLPHDGSSLPMLAVIAVWFDDVRLIDNRVISG